MTLLWHSCGAHFSKWILKKSYLHNLVEQLESGATAAGSALVARAPTRQRCFGSEPPRLSRAHSNQLETNIDNHTSAASATTNLKRFVYLEEGMSIFRLFNMKTLLHLIAD